MAKITVPKEIYKKLSMRARELGFGSTEEYIKNVLRQITNKLDAKKKPVQKRKVSKKDEKLMKARLKALGYLS